MEKILDIVEAIASENELPKDRVTEAIKESMINMAKREINEKANFAFSSDCLLYTSDAADDNRLV